jgi:hypothetical protein
MQRVLERVVEELDLGAESREKLHELTSWLEEQRQSWPEDWAPGELLETFSTGDTFDADAVHRDVAARLERLKELSTTLVDRLAAFHGTLDAEQRSALARVLARRGRQRHGRRRRHRAGRRHGVASGGGTR